MCGEGSESNIQKRESRTIKEKKKKEEKRDREQRKKGANPAIKASQTRVEKRSESNNRTTKKK